METVSIHYPRYSPKQTCSAYWFLRVTSENVVKNNFSRYINFRVGVKIKISTIPETWQRPESICINPTNISFLRLEFQYIGKVRDCASTEVSRVIDPVEGPRSVWNYRLACGKNFQRGFVPLWNAILERREAEKRRIGGRQEERRYIDGNTGEKNSSRGTVIPIFRRIYWPFCACKSVHAQFDEKKKKKNRKKEERRARNSNGAARRRRADRFKYSTLRFFCIEDFGHCTLRLDASFHLSCSIYFIPLQLIHSSPRITI